MAKSDINISVEFGTDPDLVTIRMSGRSRPMVVGLLATETNEDSEINKIYLRSRIHSNNKEVSYSGWLPSGAISTMLTKEVANDELA